jgi:predicted AAA+ superfamily ATPase
MADISSKMSAVFRLVEEGAYFTINRPRQYGKTTMLFTLAHELRKQKDVIVIQTSFEGIGDEIFSD